jgi:hypothetical protein
VDDDDDDDDDKNSGDQHAMILIKQHPRLCTSSEVELVAVTVNFFVKATD